MDINTCTVLTDDYRTIAYYSHLVPVAISLLLALFVLVESKYSRLSKIFLLFVAGFSLWLIGDVILWTSPNYYLVTAVWAPLDFINILFYLFGAYFFLVLLKDGADTTWWQKIIFLVLLIPAWWLTITGQSIQGFYQPVCEAFNNETLGLYKLGIETFVVGIIMIAGAFSLFKSKSAKKKQIALVGLALIIFFLTFSSTEYIASQTGIYEMSLYSLFVLPVFLAMIIFSITNLRIFAFKSFGTQILIYVLLIMVASQFFFIQDVTNRALTLVTLIISAFLGLVLAKNIKHEEELAVELQIANEGQATLIHFINHQIKGYFSKGRSIFAELVEDPEYGPLNPDAKEMIRTGEESLKEGVEFVQDILKASNIEKGTMTYIMEHLDYKSLVTEIVEGQRKSAEDKGLAYEFTVGEGDYHLRGDINQLKEAVRNIIGNSIVYTPQGKINITLGRNEKKAILIVKDTGIGLSEEVKTKLFTKGGRDKNSQKINVNSTGFGLSIVKGIVDAHHGKVWADSEGPGKGSTFTMELPVA